MFKNSKRFIIYILISWACLFGWAIWTGLLQYVVPRHRTFFVTYESFCKKTEHSKRFSFVSELPESSKNIKYYWGIDFFIETAGYGTSLSDEDFEKARTQALEKYSGERSIGEKDSQEALYVYADGEEKEYVYDEWLKNEWLKKYVMNKVNELLEGDEEINDYYILAYNYLDSNYVRFQCMLCNDSSKRVIELSYWNRNPS